MASLFLRISAIGASKHPSVVSLAGPVGGERLTDERLGVIKGCTEPLVGQALAGPVGGERDDARVLGRTDCTDTQE